MKKKKIQKLSLNKKAISNLENLNSIKGGASDSPGSCDHTGCSCQATCGLTCGNCIQTWGDPGCPTGIRWICIAEN